MQLRRCNYDIIVRTNAACPVFGSSVVQLALFWGLGFPCFSYCAAAVVARAHCAPTVRLLYDHRHINKQLLMLSRRFDSHIANTTISTLYQVVIIILIVNGPQLLIIPNLLATLCGTQLSYCRAHNCPTPTSPFHTSVMVAPLTRTLAASTRVILALLCGLAIVHIAISLQCYCRSSEPHLSLIVTPVASTRAVSLVAQLQKYFF